MPNKLTHNEYISEIDRLAKQIVHEAVLEGSFEVFMDGLKRKTPLQQAITNMARTVIYRHEPGDGFIPEHDNRESFPPEADTSIPVSRKSSIPKMKL